MAVLTGVLMILVPVLIWVLLRMRRTLPWPMLLLGAAAYMLAQVAKGVTGSPLLTALAPGSLGLILLSGLLPGVWETLLKWAPLTWRKARSWDDVLAFGLGFGGIEAIYLGATVIAVNVAFAQGLPEGLPESSLPMLQSILRLSAPGISLLVPIAWALERLFTTGVHMGFSYFAAYATLPGKRAFLLYAMAIHSAADMAAVAVTYQIDTTTLQIYLPQVVIGLLALGVVLMMRRFELAGDPFAAARG